MNKWKKMARTLALALALSLAVPVSAPVPAAVVCEAATVKLSATKKTLTVGKSFTLSVKGTKKKVTWSSSKKSVASVSAKGKVTAKKAGTATITAKVEGKSYTCKVTVKAAVNKYVAKAPFEAKEAKIEGYTMAIPKNWKMETATVNGVPAYVFFPEDADMNVGTSNVSVTVSKSEGAEQANFEIWKAYLEERVTKEYLETALGGQGTVTDFSVAEKKINLGKAVVTSYTAELSTGGQTATFKQMIYDIFANGYVTELTVTDNGTAVTPDVHTVAEYMVNSLISVTP